MEEVSIVVDLLRKGVSVELVGRPGSGRSTLLEQVSTNLEQLGGHAVVIRGVGALKTKPLGALVASIPDLGRQATMGETVALLRREVDGTGTIVVDDADDLDDTSAGVLAAVRTATCVPFLYTRRAGPRPLSSLRPLLASLQPSIRRFIRPMSFGDLQTLLESDLGGRVDGRTMAQIATGSGRLPGLARAIALAGKSDGTLVFADGAWQAAQSLGTSDLGQSVEAHLVDASEADIDALTTVALAGPPSVNDLRVLIPEARIESLSGLGLIDFIDGPDGGSVGVYPPLVGQYLINESTSSKRVSVREALLREGIPVPADLMSGGHPTRLADDAILSATIREHWNEIGRERLAVWEAEQSAAAGVELMFAIQNGAELNADPDAVYARSDVSHSSAQSQAELAGWFAIHLAVALDDRTGASRVLEDAARHSESGRVYAQSVAGLLELLQERVPEKLPVVMPGVAQFALEAARGLEAEVDITRGVTGGVVSDLATQRPDLPVFAHHSDSARGLARVLEGDLRLGEAWACEHFRSAQRSRNPGALQAHGYALALSQAIQGSFEQLDETISLLMTVTSVSALQAHYRTGVAGIAAAKARWLGSSPCAIEGERSWEKQSGGRGPFPFMLTAGMAGEHGDGAVLWDCAEDAAERGYLAAAAFAAVEAAEIAPDPERLQRVLPALEPITSPLVRAVVDLAEAIVAGDSGALCRLESEFATFGAWFYVARAGIRRALALREAGEFSAAVDQADSVWAVVDRETSGMQGLFCRLARSVDLSARELEVATMVVNGWAPSDIASSLVLSVRTIEHHLFNAYRKIGIDSRESLRRALTTWLQSARPSAG